MPAAKKSSKKTTPPSNKSIVTLILGILSIVFVLLPFIGAGLSIAGLIVAALDVRNSAFRPGMANYGKTRVLDPKTIIGGVLVVIALPISLYITILSGYLLVGLTTQFS